MVTALWIAVAVIILLLLVLAFFLATLWSDCSHMNRQVSANYNNAMTALKLVANLETKVDEGLRKLQQHRNVSSG